MKYCFVIVATLLTAASCNKLCDEGYEGKRCDVEVRDKFEGVWHATDNPGNITYTDTLKKVKIGNTAVDAATILNMEIVPQLGARTFIRPIKVTVNGNTINIARQKPDTSRILVEGAGTISDNAINWSYNIISTYDNDTVTTPYTGVWIK